MSRGTLLFSCLNSSAARREVDTTNIKSWDMVLPIAGVVFYNSMANFLEKVMGFSKCEQFTGVWVRLFGERGLVLVGLATDDLVKTGTRDDETQHFLERLKVEMDKR